MSNAPLVTNAKQTAATNMVAYLRNRRPDRAWGGTPPVPAPGSPEKDFIRSVPSARTRTPSANVKMRHHNTPEVPARGRILIALVFARLLAGAAKCARCFPGRRLYSFRSATASLSIQAASERPFRGGWMGIKVGRREFIALFGGALANRAISANAQELRVRTVGALMGFANDAEAKARTEAFQQGLETAGWSVGHNLRIEYRYAEGDTARMQALALELVELKPDCILAQSTPVAEALMRTTRTIP